MSDLFTRVTGDMQIKAKIAEGIEKLGLKHSPQQVDQLHQFIELLLKWNQAFNLVASNDPEYLLSHHILDSLLVSPYLRGERILDIGSGAGLPGIPLAIIHRELQLTLLDSNGKKTRFLKQVVIELDLLKRIEVVKSRIEEYRPTQPFDTVICRAFASLTDFVQSSLPVCVGHTMMLAMKGRHPGRELKELGPEVRLVNVEAVRLPGFDVERHIVCLQKELDQE